MNKARKKLLNVQYPVFVAQGELRQRIGNAVLAVEAPGARGHVAIDLWNARNLSVVKEGNVVGHTFVKGTANYEPKVINGVDPRLYAMPDIGGEVYDLDAQTLNDLRAIAKIPTKDDTAVSNVVFDGNMAYATDRYVVGRVTGLPFDLGQLVMVYGQTLDEVLALEPNGIQLAGDGIMLVGHGWRAYLPNDHRHYPNIYFFDLEFETEMRFAADAKEVINDASRLVKKLDAMDVRNGVIEGNGYRAILFENAGGLDFRVSPRLLKKMLEFTGGAEQVKANEALYLRVQNGQREAIIRMGVLV